MSFLEYFFHCQVRYEDDAKWFSWGINNGSSDGGYDKGTLMRRDKKLYIRPLRSSPIPNSFGAKSKPYGNGQCIIKIIKTQLNLEGLYLSKHI